MKSTGAIQAALDQAVRDGVFPGGVLVARVHGQLQLLVTAGRLSAEPVGLGPAELREFMKRDAARWREAMRIAGLKAQ